MTLLGLALSSIAGLFLGLVGGGGSLLIVPILHYIIGFDAQQSTFASLIVVGAVSAIGAVSYYRNGGVDVKSGVSFAIPATVGVVLSRRWLLPSLPHSISLGSVAAISKDAFILSVFGFLMLAAAYSMLKRRESNEPEKSVKSNASLFKVTSLSFAVGILTGFVGAGGGFIIVPALVTFFYLPMKTAVGTSLAIIAVNSLFGVFSNPGGFSGDKKILIFSTLVTLVGFFVGKRTSTKFGNEQLRKVFAVLTLAVAASILLKELV